MNPGKKKRLGGQLGGWVDERMEQRMKMVGKQRKNRKKTDGGMSRRVSLVN